MSMKSLWGYFLVAVVIGLFIAFPPLLMIFIVGGFICEVLFKGRSRTHGDEPGGDF